MEGANQDEQLIKASADVITRLKQLQNSEMWLDNGESFCKMYKMEIGGRLASKGVHINQFNIEKVFQFLEKEESLPKINPQVMQIKVLYEKPEVFKVNYMRYKGQWPVSDRDFVSVSAKQRQSQSKMYIGIRGCDYPYPELKGVVRGQVYIGGYIIQKVDQTHTKVTYISDVDVKGMVPGMIKNALSVRQGGTASKVGYVMKKEGY